MPAHAGIQAEVARKSDYLDCRFRGNDDEEDSGYLSTRAKKVKPLELTDSRFLNDMEKSGFWDQIWAKR